MVREVDVDKPAGPGRAEAASFSWRSRGESFRHAFGGVRILLTTQHNARIHAGLTLAVLALGLLLGVSALEWAVLALAIGLVWCAEALNSALEWLCDVASPEYHPLVRRAKDVAAAGVLFAAVAAAAAGLLVFVPHLVGCAS